MADKSIHELEIATEITDVDSFVLEQDGVAKQLMGETLLECLAIELDAHGGIKRIDGPTTVGLVDTYTIVFSDNTTWDFSISNGKQITGITKTGVDPQNPLKDIYTISYNNNTTDSFTVTNGKAISSIAKTGVSPSDVLTDVYTITYNDTSTDEIDVTNGKGISSINKTGVSPSDVLTDVYTITYNNNTTDEFTVTNGKSITSIAKTGVSPSDQLTDEYTITFNNNTTSIFYVRNGCGIESIEKTGTSGLVDTYTISLSDGTTTTFTVTNGEKGDTPVVSTVVEYGTSNAEDVQPTSWVSTMPSVAQGGYLWTRVTLSYSTGSPDSVFYSKARWGVNGGGGGGGSGSVETVNGVLPDANGNVALISVVGKKLVIKEVV